MLLLATVTCYLDSWRVFELVYVRPTVRTRKTHRWFEFPHCVPRIILVVAAQALPVAYLFFHFQSPTDWCGLCLVGKRGPH